jgi:hypothetical protein
MLVEMASSDNMEENVASPLGSNGYAGPIFVCLPTAFAQMKNQLIQSIHAANMN